MSSNSLSPATTTTLAPIPKKNAIEIENMGRLTEASSFTTTMSSVAAKETTGDLPMKYVPSAYHQYFNNSTRRRGADNATRGKYRHIPPVTKSFSSSLSTTTATATTTSISSHTELEIFIDEDEDTKSEGSVNLEDLISLDIPPPSPLKRVESSEAKKSSQQKKQRQTDQLSSSMHNLKHYKGTSSSSQERTTPSKPEKTSKSKLSKSKSSRSLTSNMSNEAKPVKMKKSKSLRALKSKSSSSEQPLAPKAAVPSWFASVSSKTPPQDKVTLTTNTKSADQQSHPESLELPKSLPSRSDSIKSLEESKAMAAALTQEMIFSLTKSLRSLNYDDISTRDEDDDDENEDDHRAIVETKPAAALASTDRPKKTCTEQSLSQSMHNLYYRDEPTVKPKKVVHSTNSTSTKNKSPDHGRAGSVSSKSSSKGGNPASVSSKASAKGNNAASSSPKQSTAVAATAKNHKSFTDISSILDSLALESSSNSGPYTSNESSTPFEEQMRVAIERERNRRKSLIAERTGGKLLEERKMSFTQSLRNVTGMAQAAATGSIPELSTARSVIKTTAAIQTSPKAVEDIQEFSTPLSSRQKKVVPSSLAVHMKAAQLRLKSVQPNSSIPSHEKTASYLVEKRNSLRKSTRNLADEQASDFKSKGKIVTGELATFCTPPASPSTAPCTAEAEQSITPYEDQVKVAIERERRRTSASTTAPPKIRTPGGAGSSVRARKVMLRQSLPNITLADACRAAAESLIHDDSSNSDDIDHYLTPCGSPTKKTMGPKSVLSLEQQMRNTSDHGTGMRLPLSAPIVPAERGDNTAVKRISVKIRSRGGGESATSKGDISAPFRLSLVKQDDLSMFSTPLSSTPRKTLPSKSILRSSFAGRLPLIENEATAASADANNPNGDLIGEGSLHFIDGNGKDERKYSLPTRPHVVKQKKGIEKKELASPIENEVTDFDLLRTCKKNSKGKLPNENASLGPRLLPEAIRKSITLLDEFVDASDDDLPFDEATCSLSSWLKLNRSEPNVCYTGDSSFTSFDEQIRVARQREKERRNSCVKI